MCRPLLLFLAVTASASASGAQTIVWVGHEPTAGSNCHAVCSCAFTWSLRAESSTVRRVRQPSGTFQVFNESDGREACRLCFSSDVFPFVIDINTTTGTNSTGGPPCSTLWVPLPPLSPEVHFADEQRGTTSSLFADPALEVDVT